jgi:23S rRNA U2552 (ribose-2'-O)-methylase RlmE/FtsJ
MYSSGYQINDYIFSINESTIQMNYGDTFSDSFITNESLREYLQKIKTEIDNYYDMWDIYKKITNKYEYINTHYYNEKKHINTCVCSYKPISRSYFKMVEILNNFDFDFNQDKINSFHLAEGPGGFIECLYKHRNNTNDTYVGMTLIENDKDVPKWGKMTNFLKNKKNILLEYGPKKDGNLYMDYNLHHIIKNHANKYDFVTGDGGFDYSIDFNKQEQYSINLIFCEVLYALILQKQGGSFVLKVFDCFHRNTIEILYLLSYFYEKVHVYKPNTSREANSEKYVICNNFQIKTNYNELIQKLCMNFHDLSKQKLQNIFDFEINTMFLSKIQEVNAIYGQQQIENILTTINYIKENQNTNKDKMERIKMSNIDKCIKWCNLYHQPISSVFTSTSSW